LERQALGFGFRIVGGTEEGSQVCVGYIVKVNLVFHLIVCVIQFKLIDYLFRMEQLIAIHAYKLAMKSSILMASML
jgi:hypothetical protein